MAGSQRDDNVEVVKQVYDSFSEGNIEAAIATWDENIEMHEPEGFASGGGIHHGPDEILEDVFARLRNNWEDVSVVPEQFVEGGDTIVMLGRWSGTYIDTGKTVSFPLAHVFDLVDGKIVEWQSFGDTALFNAALED